MAIGGLGKIVSIILLIVTLLITLFVTIKPEMGDLVSSFTDSKLNQIRETNNDVGNNGYVNYQEKSSYELMASIESMAKDINSVKDKSNCVIELSSPFQNFNEDLSTKTSDFRFKKSEGGIRLLARFSLGLPVPEELDLPLEGIKGVYVLKDSSNYVNALQTSNVAPSDKQFFYSFLKGFLYTAKPLFDVENSQDIFFGYFETNGGVNDVSFNFFDRSSQELILFQDGEVKHKWGEGYSTAKSIDGYHFFKIEDYLVIYWGDVDWSIYNSNTETFPLSDNINCKKISSKSGFTSTLKSDLFFEALRSFGNTVNSVFNTKASNSELCKITLEKPFLTSFDEITDHSAKRFSSYFIKNSDGIFVSVFSDTSEIESYPLGSNLKKIYRIYDNKNIFELDSKSGFKKLNQLIMSDNEYSTFSEAKLSESFSRVYNFLYGDSFSEFTFIKTDFISDLTNLPSRVKNTFNSRDICPNSQFDTDIDFCIFIENNYKESLPFYNKGTYQKVSSEKTGLSAAIRLGDSLYLISSPSDDVFNSLPECATS